MAQITIKMLREIDELATREIERYANDLSDEIIPTHRELIYYARMNGGCNAVNFIIRYLIRQLEEEQQ